MTDSPDRYPCPDKRCPGLIALDQADLRDDPHECPYCGSWFTANEIRLSPRWQTWQAAPKTAENSHVQFWSMPVKRRLEQSTIGPNQAAKRDLTAYAALIDGALPAIHRTTAEALVRYLMTRREDLATPSAIIAGWSHLIDAIAGVKIELERDRMRFDDLYLPALLIEKYALIDAADRAIKEYDDTPEPHLPEIVARHFRITPERS